MIDKLDHKEIITRLAAIAEEVKAGCGCGGSGKLWEPGMAKDDTYSCPDCAEIRALDLCWHSCEKGTVDKRYMPEEIYYCDGCGKGPRTFKDDWENPDLTTHMYGGKLWIVHCLEVLGEWNEFCNYLIRTNSRHGLGYSNPYVRKIIDITKDGEHLVPAIGAYLKERNGS